jgi:hypothetical protein
MVRALAHRAVMARISSTSCAPITGMPTSISGTPACVERVRDGQLLVVAEGHARGLLTVAQRGVVDDQGRGGGASVAFHGRLRGAAQALHRKRCATVLDATLQVLDLPAFALCRLLSAVVFVGLRQPGGVAPYGSRSIAMGGAACCSRRLGAPNPLASRA